MESEQTTNQKCLSFLDHAAEQQQQRKKLSESLEEEFEKLIIAEGYDINGGGDTSSLKENDEERMMTRSQTKMKKPTSSSKGEIKRTVKPNRAQLLRNAQMEKVLFGINLKKFKLIFQAKITISTIISVNGRITGHVTVGDVIDWIWPKTD